ncbi:dihydrolipoamide dehydrogenase [Puniceibacterium confluentis]|uniref:dihydrolipoamide dehydrogenase n=1 Tax=Puniceibacterium confluentis TaxID=1958944 RepID=UPI003566F827
MASINRIVMSKSSRTWIRALGPEGLDTAEISGSSGKNFPFRSYKVFHYPEYDICAAPLGEQEGTGRQFDLIMADQVWEHLDRPYAATKHVLASLKPGGFFWLAVPFFVPLHAAPVDNSRWSARGLKNLLIECGFAEEDIVADQWGNRWAGMRNVVGPFPPVYYPETDRLDNEEDFPVCAWALAQKAEQADVD